MMYDEWNGIHYKHHSQHQFSTALRMLNTLDLKPDESVLDIGCGDASITAEVAKRVKHVVGIDSSHSMIDTATETLKSFTNASCRELEVEQIDEIEKYDVVISFSTFHWIADQQKALDNIYRAMRSPGRLFISTSAGVGAGLQDSPMNKMFKDPRWAGKIENRFNVRSLQDFQVMLERIGFSHIRLWNQRNDKRFQSEQDYRDWLNGFIPYATGLKGELLDEFINGIIHESNEIVPGRLLNVKAKKLA